MYLWLQSALVTRSSIVWRYLAILFSAIFLALEHAEWGSHRRITLSLATHLTISGPEINSSWNVKLCLAIIIPHLLSVVALKDRSRKSVPNTDPEAPAAGHRQPWTQTGASWQNGDYSLYNLDSEQSCLTCPQWRTSGRAPLFSASLTLPGVALHINDWLLFWYKEIKLTFLVLMQKVPLHELCLSPQPVLDVLKGDGPFVRYSKSFGTWLGWLQIPLCFIIQLRFLILPLTHSFTRA